MHALKIIDGVRLRRSLGGRWMFRMDGHIVVLTPIKGRHNRVTNSWKWHVSHLEGAEGVVKSLKQAVKLTVQAIENKKPTTKESPAME